MKMKKILILLLGLFMTLSLVGCGSKGPREAVINHVTKYGEKYDKSCAYEIEFYEEKDSSGKLEEYLGHKYEKDEIYLTVFSDYSSVHTFFICTFRFDGDMAYIANVDFDIHLGDKYFAATFDYTFKDHKFDQLKNFKIKRNDFPKSMDNTIADLIAANLVEGLEHLSQYLGKNNLDYFY